MVKASADRFARSTADNPASSEAGTQSDGFSSANGSLGGSEPERGCVDGEDGGEVSAARGERGERGGIGREGGGGGGGSGREGCGCGSGCGESFGAMEEDEGLGGMGQEGSDREAAAGVRRLANMARYDVGGVQGSAGRGGGARVLI